MNSHETEKGRSDHVVSSASSAQERRDWLRSWVRENPRATIELAKKALKDQFGLAVGTEVVANILRETQEELLQRGKEAAHVISAGVAAVVETPALILDIVNRMKAAGIRRIEILPTGYDVLFGT